MYLAISGWKASNLQGEVAKQLARLSTIFSWVSDHASTHVGVLCQHIEL